MKPKKMQLFYSVINAVGTLETELGRYVGECRHMFQEHKEYCILPIKKYIVVKEHPPVLHKRKKHCRIKPRRGLLTQTSVSRTMKGRL